MPFIANLLNFIEDFMQHGLLLMDHDIRKLSIEPFEKVFYLSKVCKEGTFNAFFQFLPFFIPRLQVQTSDQQLGMGQDALAGLLVAFAIAFPPTRQLPCRHGLF